MFHWYVSMFNVSSHLFEAADSSVVPKGYTPYTPYTRRKFQDNLGCT